jgi:hypothetical protein
MPTPLVVYWYKIPKETLARAKQHGFSRVPTEIGLRPQTGEDVEKALAGAEAMKQMAAFRLRMIKATICGVNFDPACKTEGRKACSRGSDDPNLIPDNIWAELPASVTTLLQIAFADINECEEDEAADFKKGRSVVA